MSEPDQPDKVESDRWSAAEIEVTAATRMLDPTASVAGRTRALLATSALTWAAYSIRAVFVSPWVLAFSLLGAVSNAALYLALRRRQGWARAIAHLTILSSVASIVGLALVSGNIRAPVLWYLVCVPMLAAYVFGVREAILWTAVSASGVGLVELSRRYFPLAQAVPLKEEELWGRVILLLVVVLGFASITARTHAEQVTVLEQRESVIRNLLQGVARKNEETLRARDAALDASRAKGEFLAMMSHEIRTPLNAVLGLTGVLLDGTLAPEEREIVRTIRSSGDSLLLLLNDILDFSKIEAGRLQLESAPFDVVDCAEDALDLFSAAATEKGLDLSCHVSSDVPARAFGDAGRVRQILVNLVSNAIKFTLRGSVQVFIDAEPIPGAEAGSADSRIHCAVRDTGIGIPEGHLSALFQPFSQVDASTTRRFGGTGLGLAICRKLAERMGGEVWAESKKGAGSTFHFTFLARGMAALPPPDAASAQDQPAIVVSPREGTRTAVASQLTAIGLQVTTCPDIAALREAAAEMRPDVVVVDEKIAAADVREALSRMHRLPAFVLLSTAGRESAARRGLREKWGPEPVIVALPVRRTALREAVLHALGLDETPLPHSSSVPPLANDLPLRILIAEDNPVNQRVALLLLERLGYRADVVGNGAEAVEAVRARPYDVILMDVRMPEVDGIEATRRIRGEIGKDRQPHIIALTANAMAEDRKACEAAGMDDFLSKPLTSRELARALHGARDRSSLIVPESALGTKELDALRRLTAGSPEVLRQIIDEYLETAGRLMAAIRDAASRGDTKALERAAHSLKGSSGQMGAMQVMFECAAIERAASVGDLPAARDRLSMLAKKHEGTKTKMKALRDAVQASPTEEH